MIVASYLSTPQARKLNAPALTYSTLAPLAALFLQVAQIGLINTELSTIRLTLAGATLILLTAATLMRVGERSYHAGISIVFAFTMLLSWAISILLFGGVVNWNAIGIQLAFPIYLGAISAFDSRNLLRWVTLMSAGTIVYAATYALINPSVILDQVPRAQGFLENRAPHNSAYTVASILIFFYIVGFKQRRIPKWFWVAIFLVSAALLYAYKVRTAQVMVMGFFGTMAAQYLRPRYGNASLAFIFFVMAFAATSYVSNSSTIDLFQFSSGRTSVYVERIGLISERSWTEIMFGSGPGSDSFYSKAWWWEAKNSHNDFLTTLIERGVVGLVLLIWYLFAYCRSRRPETIAIVTAIALTGIVSNGLFQRPMPLLFAAFAIWASVTGRSIIGKRN